MGVHLFIALGFILVEITHAKASVGFIYSEILFLKLDIFLFAIDKRGHLFDCLRVDFFIYLADKPLRVAHDLFKLFLKRGAIGYSGVGLFLLLFILNVYLQIAISKLAYDGLVDINLANSLV